MSLHPSPSDRFNFHISFRLICMQSILFSSPHVFYFIYIALLSHPALRRESLLPVSSRGSVCPEISSSLISPTELDREGATFAKGKNSSRLLLPVALLVTPFGAIGSPHSYLVAGSSLLQAISKHVLKTERSVFSKVTCYIPNLVLCPAYLLTRVLLPSSDCEAFCISHAEYYRSIETFRHKSFSRSCVNNFSN